MAALAVPVTWAGRVPLPKLAAPRVTIVTAAGPASSNSFLIGIDPSRYSDASTFLKGRGWKIVAKTGDFYQVDVGSSTSVELAAKLQAIRSSALFFLAEYDVILNIGSFSDPDPALNDTRFWNIDAIHARQAWTIVSAQGQTGTPKLGFLDNGYSTLTMGDVSLASVTDAIADSTCANVTPDDKEFPKCNHGYHVAGIAGATGNNGKDAVGIGSGSTNSHSLIAANVAGASPLVPGLDALIPGGAQIINLSQWNGSLPSSYVLDGSLNSDEIAQAIESANSSSRVIRTYFERIQASGAALPDVVVAQISGNAGTLTDGSNKKIGAELAGLFATFLIREQTSSAYAHVRDRTLVVGAFDKSRQVAASTMLPPAGPMAERFILAPGVDIYSTTRQGLRKMSGTSQAAPHVAGVASLIKQVNPALSGKEVADIILQTASNQSDAEWNPGDGYKYLNAERATREALRRKNAVNCGTVAPPFPTASAPNLATYTVTAGQATSFTTVPAPKAGFPFADYRWTTSEVSTPIASGSVPSTVITLSSVTANTPAAVTVTPVLADGTVSTESAASSQVNVSSAAPTIIAFTERPDSGSGWNLKILLTSKDAAGNSGTFDFGSGTCTGKLTYKWRDGSGNFLLQEIHETGGCHKTCDIIVSADANSYSERCYGSPYNGAIISPANRPWVTPHPTTTDISRLLASPVGVLNSSNGHIYQLATCGDWNQCRDYANSRGGQLATIRSAAENRWIVENVTSKYSNNVYKAAFMGLYRDPANFANWLWLSGEPLSFTNWHPGEPNNAGGTGETAGMIFSNLPFGGSDPGVWNDTVPNMTELWDRSPINQAVIEYR